MKPPRIRHFSTITPPGASSRQSSTSRVAATLTSRSRGRAGVIGPVMHALGVAMAAIALEGSGFAGSAQAAIVSGTFAFNASEFPGKPPNFSLSGSFTLSFDNSADITDSTLLTVNSLTPNLAQVVYSYNKLNDRLVFGGVPSGALGVQADDGDFSVRFEDVSSINPSLFRVWVGDTDDFAVREASKATGSFTPADDRQPVPEPTSIALVSAGLLAMTGLSARRRRAG